MMVVLMGPPGVGKGTQAVRLEAELGLPKVSTGDLLRAARRDESDLGHRAASFMDRGALVPDDLIIALIERRLSQADAAGGAILDGFPRTLAQAETLDQILAKGGHGVDTALLLTVDEAVIVERILGRQICSDCAAVFHRSARPPRLPGLCDDCGAALQNRSDDNELAIRTRLAAYRTSTEPVIEFYRSKEVLRQVDGGQAVDEVFAELKAALEH